MTQIWTPAQVRPLHRKLAARTANVFCPTGPGGGIKPTCSPQGGGAAAGGKGTLAGSLGIPRADMPQIKGTDHEEFIAFAASKGIRVKNERVDPSSLRPAQREVNPAQVAGLPDEALRRPIFISKDDYVLDGHNRWARLREEGAPSMDVRRVDLPAREALTLMHSFPKASKKDITHIGPTKTANQGWQPATVYPIRPSKGGVSRSIHQKNPTRNRDVPPNNRSIGTGLWYRAEVLPLGKIQLNAFCPTGKGGGIDPTCGKGKGAGGGGGTGAGSASAGIGKGTTSPTSDVPGSSSGDYPKARPKGTDSLEQHTTASGQWTPERQVLHRSIVDKAFEGKTPVDKPTAFIMGGGPAAGKSTVIGTGQLKIPENTVHVDPDGIKSALPEFREGLAKRDRNTAAFVHEESVEIGKQVQGRASAGNFNTLHDGTGDSGIEKLSKKIQVMKDAGQRVVAHYVTVDTEVAVQRAEARGNATGRYVPESVVRESHANVSRVVPEAVRRGLFDEFSLWDTSGGSAVKVAEARGKDLRIHDQGLWQRFLDKGK